MRASPTALLALLAAGCSTPDPQASWWEQREPSGPCWTVNLADGLDTESADELHDLYGCLNQDGAFDALAGMDAAMDAQSREGRPLGAEVGLLAQGLAGSDIDVFGLAGKLLPLVRDEDGPVGPMMDILVELMYGQPYTVVAGGGVQLASESALEDGVITPMLPAVREAAAALQDDDGAALDLLADALESEDLDDGVCTLVGLASSDDDDVADLREHLLPDLGAAIELSRDPSNDRWSEATGDSLRDLVDAGLLSTRGDGQNAVAALSDDLAPILQDDAVRDRLKDLLSDLDAQGEIEDLPLWALHLASVDVDGTPLCDADTTTGCSNEDSALTALIRLLAESNEQVECSVAGFEVYSGNLAVDLLIQISGIQSDTIESVNALLGDVLGWSITGDLLSWLLGACSGIDDTDQLVTDLNSLDRLNDPESGELLGVLVDALGALYDEDAGVDELQPLVDVLTVVDGRELIPPVEEVLRDLASSALMGDVAKLVPLILDPSPLAVDACPEGSAPLDFDAVWDMAGAGLLGEGRDEPPLQTLQSVLNATLGQEGTWTAMGNLAALMQEDEATLQDLWTLAPKLVEADPELSLVQDLGPVLRDPEVVGPALRLGESTDLIDAVGHTELSQEGPLPFGARLVTGGTVDSLLRTLNLALDALGA